MNGSDFLIYEDLLKKADAEGLIVREKELPGYDGGYRTDCHQ